MNFVDPDTGLFITCQPWEYEQIRGQFIKTKWSTNLTDEDLGNARCASQTEDV